MAESSLSLTSWDLFERVGDMLGYPSAQSGCEIDGEAFAQVRQAVEDGYRQFLFPPPVNGRRHSWRFLSPQATLALRATYKESLSGAGASLASTVVTQATAKFLSYGVVAGDVLTATATVGVTAGDYVVASVDSETQLTLETAPGTGILHYTVGAAASQYPLPDDFGGSLIDGFAFPAGTGYRTIQQVSAAMIDQYRSASDTTGEPTVFALRPRSFTNTTGQRWEVVFYPTPSTSRTMIYRYNSMPGKLFVPRITGSVVISGTTNQTGTTSGLTAAGVVAGDKLVLSGSGGATEGVYTILTKDADTQFTIDGDAGGSGTMTYSIFPATTYPLGGVEHNNCLLASCKAMAEINLNDGADVWQGKWLEALAASVMMDEEKGPWLLGYNGDSSDRTPETAIHAKSLTVGTTVIF